MCSHDILQHKYQNHSPLTHQQYRAAGVHWLALGRRGGEPVVQQNKAHKKLGRGRPHLINSWAQLQLDMDAPLNKILDCHWRGPAHNMTDRKGVDNRSLRLIYENHDNETRLHGSGPRTLSRPLQKWRERREKKVTWNRLFCDVHKSDQNLTSRNQIKLTVDGNGNKLGRRSRSGNERRARSK